MDTSRVSGGLLTGRRGRLAAIAMAAALVPVTAAAGSGARAQAALHARPATAGAISTIAGGVGGPGKATSVGVYACGVAFGNGYLYLGDSAEVRKVSPASGWLTTPAGSNSAALAGDRGLATKASLSDSCGVAVDHAGNLVIADRIHNRIRVVAAVTGTFYGQAMTAGHIYTVAGNGRGGYSGDGGPATSAKVHLPWQVAVDGAGNLVIADTVNDRIRVVAVTAGTFYGQAMTAGHIYTVAGDGGEGFSGDGVPATATALNVPVGVAVDGAGNLVIADSGNDRVRVVAVSSGTFYGQAMTAGDIYTVAGTGTPGFSGDGGPATSAELSDPDAVTVDGAGNLVIADTQNFRIRVVPVTAGTFYGQPMTAGDIYTVAGTGHYGFSGDGGPATAAELNFPFAVAVDGAGNLVIADTANNRDRVVAAGTGSFYGQPMTAGDIYTVAGNGWYNFSGDRGPATHAELYRPYGVAVDGAGNLVLADDGHYLIRVLAASTRTFYGQAMTAGDIYTVAGNGSQGYSGDGGPATSAELSGSARVAVDGAGNLVIADAGNERVRVVAASSGSFYGQAMTAGDIYTVAGDSHFGYSGDGGPATSASLDAPAGVAVDGAGNLVIADVGNERVRVVAASSGVFYGQAMSAGDIYTVAGDGDYGFSGDGGRATSAELAGPQEVAVDGAGNLVIADLGNERVRVVAASSGSFYGQAMTAGDIYTVAGDGIQGFSGDGGPATSAQLSGPDAVTVDGAGNLVIADEGNDRVRVVAANTGSFYGQAMTAGDIYTVAGNGKTGFTGDSGQATHAELARPNDVAVDPSGNLVIADTGNNRLRMVTG